MLQFLPQIQTSPFEKIVLPYGHLKGLLKIQKSVVKSFGHLKKGLIYNYAVNLLII